MYQQLQDGPFHLAAALPAAQQPQHQSPRSSSFSPQPRPCPCCPSLILPAVFTDRFSTAFFTSCCLLWLSVILSITATSVADFMRLTVGSSVSISVGAWRVCTTSVGRYSCSALTQSAMDVLLLDSVVFDGFRAFVILSILLVFTAAILSTVRLVLQQQRQRLIPRWADVSIITVASLSAACFVVAFALFLDCFRLVRGSKGYGSSFVCLMVAAGVCALGLVVHSIAWHFLANNSRAARAAAEPQPLMMQQLQQSAAAPGQQQQQHGPYSLAPYIPPQPYYAQYPFSSPAAHLPHPPPPFPAHYGHASAPFLHPPPPPAHLYAPPGPAQYAVHSVYSPAAAAFAAPPAAAAAAAPPPPASAAPPAAHGEGSPQAGAVSPSAPAAAPEAASAV